MSSSLRLVDLQIPDGSNSVTNGQIICVGYAVCDDDLLPITSIDQGQFATVVGRFRIAERLDALGFFIELVNEHGVSVYAQNSLLDIDQPALLLDPAAEVEFRHRVQLDLQPGTYSIQIGVVDVPEDLLSRFNHPTTDSSLWPYDVQERYSRLGDFWPWIAAQDEVTREMNEHVRVVITRAFTVGLNDRGQLNHYGLANLPASLSVLRGPFDSVVRDGKDETSAGGDGDLPAALVHVTHWKAGSQWIFQILQQCAGHLTQAPGIGSAQGSHLAPRPGHIYPAAFLTRDEAFRLVLPAKHHFLIVVRDLRDTLVSAYFSLLLSHPIVDRSNEQLRSLVSGLPQEEALIYLMDYWLPGCARIQLSWLESGEELVRYEDLLVSDLEILGRHLISEARLDVSREALEQAVVANRFESLSGGRARGDEDVHSHYRKGVAGDWRSHFTGRVKDAFKRRYGGILVATGYEDSLDW